MTTLLCPTCVEPLDPASEGACPCGRKLPTATLRRWQQSPPMWVVAVGYPEVGKSTHLGALLVWLNNLGKVVPGFSCAPADSESAAWMTSERDTELAGRAAAIHGTEEIRTGVFELRGLPPELAGGRREVDLIVSDVPGEHYEGNAFTDVARHLRVASHAWFFVSLHEVRAAIEERRQAKTIVNLLDRYRVALDGNIAGRQLVVVLTKADKLGDDIDARAAAYLRDDPLAKMPITTGAPIAPIAVPRYLAALGDMSEVLRGVVEDEAEGHPFVTGVETGEASVAFCITAAQASDTNSAQEFDPESGRFRIIDPLLLTLSPPRGSRPGTSPGRIVIDASSAVSLATLKPLADAVARELSRRGEVATHVLGRTMPVGKSSSAPLPALAATGKPRAALIGPILRRAGASGGIVAAITDMPIVDLGDHAGTPWARRMHVFTTQASVRIRWSNLHWIDPALDVASEVGAALQSADASVGQPASRTPSPGAAMNDGSNTTRASNAGHDATTGARRATPRVEVDAAGYPRVLFESSQLWVHLLPVTKIQFEQFICDRPSARFDATWYEGFVKDNPRISPQDAKESNYWQLLATNLIPDEAEAMAIWAGGEARVPTADEWRKIARVAEAEAPIQPEELAGVDGLDSLALRTLRAITVAVRERLVKVKEPKPMTLADQMLLRGGCYEWVRSPSDRDEYGLLGKPRHEFAGGIGGENYMDAKVVKDPDARHKAQGVRLVWSAA